MARINTGLAAAVGGVIVGVATVVISIAAIEHSPNSNIWTNVWTWMGVCLALLGLAVPIAAILLSMNTQKPRKAVKNTRVDDAGHPTQPRAAAISIRAKPEQPKKEKTSAAGQSSITEESVTPPHHRGQPQQRRTINSEAPSSIRKESFNDADYLNDAGERAAASHESVADEIAMPEASSADLPIGLSSLRGDRIGDDQAYFELFSMAADELLQVSFHLHEADGPVAAETIDRLHRFLQRIDSQISSIPRERQDLDISLRACAEALAVARRHALTVRFMKTEWERRRGDTTRSPTSLSADYDSLLERQGELEASLRRLTQSIKSLTESISRHSQEAY